MKHTTLIITAAIIVGITSTASLSVVAYKMTSLQHEQTMAAAADAVSNSDQPQPTKYEYKMVQNVDECVLNYLASTGWQALQFGDASTQFVKTGSTCQFTSPSLTNTMFSWVLFQKQVSQ